MIGSYFNARADTWDKVASEKDSDKLERLAQKLQLKPGMKVLDIGTGTGVLLPYLVRSVGHTGRILALDVADKMLARAMGKNLSDRIDYVCACVRYTPFATETCDAVVCYSSFPHFHNKAGALLEIKRVLRKGGRVFVCHTSSREQINGIHHHVTELRHDLLPGIDEMRSLLVAAGYDEITVEETSESYFASGRKPE